VSPSWSSSAFNDTYKYADTSEKKQKIVDQAERQQYTDGYEKGIRDGKLDLASNKEKAKKRLSQLVTLRNFKIGFLNNVQEFFR
jgi:hypothetical protein